MNTGTYVIFYCFPFAISSELAALIVTIIIVSNFLFSVKIYYNINNDIGQTIKHISP